MMVEAKFTGPFTRLAPDVVRIITSYLCLPGAVRLSLSCQMAYRSLLGSDYGRRILTRQALSQTFGFDLNIQGYGEDDFPQALELYYKLAKHWTFSYGRLFSFKASAGFRDQHDPLQNFAPKNLYEASLHPYKSCDVLEDEFALVTGVIVPETMLYR